MPANVGTETPGRHLPQIPHVEAVVDENLATFKNLGNLAARLAYLCDIIVGAVLPAYNHPCIHPCRAQCLDKAQGDDGRPAELVVGT